MADERVRIASFLDETMNRRDTSNKQLGTDLGVSHVTIGRWRSGEDIPSPANCRKLAGYLHMTEERIMEMAGHMPERGLRPPPRSPTETIRNALSEIPVPIPVYDQIVHAGLGGVPVDYAYFPIPEARTRNLKAVYVEGDCMAPVLLPGDLIIVDMDGSPVAGDVVVALVNEESVEVKLLKSIEDSHVVLSCENPAYEDTLVEDIKILGVVIQTTRKLKR